MYNINLTCLYKYSLEEGVTPSDVILALRARGAGWWVTWRFVGVLLGAAAAQEAPSY